MSGFVRSIALVIATTSLARCNFLDAVRREADSSQILTVGPIHIGEPLDVARGQIGKAQAVTWGDTGKAIACRRGDAFIALKVVDGRVGGIDVARVARLDLENASGISFPHYVSGLPRCRISVTSLDWLGQPLFSGRAREIPDGWAIDPQYGVLNDGQITFMYINRDSSYTVFRSDVGPLGWFLDINGKS